MLEHVSIKCPVAKAGFARALWIVGLQMTQLIKRPIKSSQNKQIRIANVIRATIFLNEYNIYLYIRARSNFTSNTLYER